MDLTYFDELIKEADAFLSTLTTEDSRGVIHNLIVNYKGFRDRIKSKLKKRNFGDYQTSLKNFDILAKKSKDELKASFKPIVNQARNQLDNIRFNYWHKSARSSGLENKVTRALDFLDNFYEQFSDGLESFEGQLYENNKLNMKRIIKEYGVSPMFKEFCNKVVNSLNKNFDGVVLKIDGLSAGIKIPNLSDTGLYHTRNFGTDSYDLVVKLEDVDNNFVKISSRGGYTHNSEDPQDAADYIALIARAIEKKSNDYRFNKKPNLPLQEKKMIVKTISAKTLKRELRESRERFALGLGFGDKPAYESNIDAQTKDYDRKIANSGGFGYGAGFKKMDESKMVEFVMEVVSSLKGKTEYHNLQFVNRIGGQYNLAEAKINTLKKVIKSDKTGLKVRKYVNESIAPEMYETYNEYHGLTNDSDTMVSEIKSCFNKNKKSTGSVSEAVSMTSSELDIPMEMVQEMYDKLKESYETVMEGGTMDVNESLKGIYEKYRGMSEGSMDGLIDEIDDMMGYDEPRDSEPSGHDYPEDDFYLEDDDSDDNPFGDKFGSEEDGYNPFEEYDADNPEDMFEEECLECDDELNEFDDIYESKKKKYKYDTGLSTIFHVEKNSSLENIKGLNENFFRLHSINTSILNEKYVKFIIESLKIKQISSCRNFVLLENGIYDIKNKAFLKNNVLTESIFWKNISVINEAKGLSWWGNFAQNIVSVGSVVSNVLVPGSGIAIEFVNGLISLLRGYFSEDDPELQNSLYLNGAITLGFTLLGSGFGGGASVGLKMLVGSGKIAAPVVLKALLWLLGKMGYLFGRIISYLSRGVSDRLFRFVARFIPAVKPSAGLTGKAATQDIIAKCTTILNKMQTKLTNYVNKLVGKAAVTKLAGKKGFDTFFTTAARGAVTINSAQAAALLSKLGYVSGKVLKGGKYTIQSVAANGRVTILARGARAPFIMTTQNFLESVLRTKTFKDYVGLVFKNPSTYALAYKFLSGFGFSDNGNIESVDTGNMPSIDIAAQLSAEDLNLEVAGYEGDTQNYTVKNEVSVVQTALQDVLGINVGSTGIDGKYGPATKEAIQNALGISGFPMETKITAKSVIGIGVAILMKKGIEEKAAVSELFNKAITDSDALKAANEIINNPKSTADVMAQKLKTLAGVTQKTFDTQKIFSSPLAEGAFHETYKRMFG